MDCSKYGTKKYEGESQNIYFDELANRLQQLFSYDFQAYQINEKSVYAMVHTPQQ